MAPRGKQTNFEERQDIVKLHSEGLSIREISKITGKPRSTVQNIVTRYIKEFRLANKSRGGQGKKLNSHDERRILKEVKLNPFVSAPELKLFVEKQLEKTVCAETIRNVLRSNDFHGRIMRKKPFISVRNKEKRLKFAKEYLSKAESFWNTVGKFKVN
uniref:Transposable element Tc1 transposase n=1 Tax=Bactrocera dorsalis TaxID=27457 RepID=A0A034WVZ0_BACDO